MTYEVYIARDNQDRVLYVGSGRKGRHKHLTSGISSCYEANKYHFEGKVLHIEVWEKETKVESLRSERYIIKWCPPLWNIKPVAVVREDMAESLTSVYMEYNESRGYEKVVFCDETQPISKGKLPSYKELCKKYNVPYHLLRSKTGVFGSINTTYRSLQTPLVVIPIAKHLAHIWYKLTMYNWSIYFSCDMRLVAKTIGLDKDLKNITEEICGEYGLTLATYKNHVKLRREDFLECVHYLETVGIPYSYRHPITLKDGMETLKFALEHHYKPKTY